jgi:hypothetical protein
VLQKGETVEAERCWYYQQMWLREGPSLAGFLQMWLREGPSLAGLRGCGVPCGVAILIMVVDFGIQIEIEIGIGIDGKDGNSTPIPGIFHLADT